MFLKKPYFWIGLMVLVILNSIGLWDNSLYIGGDVMVPIIPSNNLHKINMWFAGSDSLHYLHIFWYLYYYLLELIGFNSTIAQKLLILSSSLLSYSFCYLIYSEIFQKKLKNNDLSGSLLGIFYSITPVTLLIVPGYLPYYGIPIASFFLLRYLFTDKIIYTLLFSFSVNHFFFIDLPQPKILSLLPIFFVYLIVITFDLIKDWKILACKIFKLGVSFVFLNSFIFIPFVYSMFYGGIGKVAGSVSSHNGLADLGSASLFYISRFFNTSVFVGYEKVSDLVNSSLFNAWGFVLIFTVCYYLFFAKKENRIAKISVISGLCLIFFIFVSKGPNPPFGSIYQWIVNNIPVLRIFRTTANISIYSVFPYALLLTMALSKLLSQKLIGLVVLIHILIFGPILMGVRYYNRNSSPSTKGVLIPNSYYDISDYLDKNNSGGKILIISFPDGYVNKTWGYFGPDIISWMTRADLVYRSDLFGLSTQNNLDLSNVNSLGSINDLVGVDLVVIQKDSFGLDEKYSLDESLKKIKETENFVVLKKEHATIQQKDIVISKINNTKYIVKLENLAKGSLKTFSIPENFHKDWRIFPDMFSVYSLDNSHTGLKKLGETGMNSWALEIDKICSSNSQLCAYNQDGTAQITLTVEFWPQRLLYLGIIISTISTLSLLGLNFLTQKRKTRQ